MALGYGCLGDECTKPVAWLLTNLPSGSTLSICEDDFPVIIIPVLAGELGVDAGRLYDVIRKHVDKEAKRLAAEAIAEANALEAADFAENAGVNHVQAPEAEAEASTDPADMTDAEYYGGHST